MCLIRLILGVCGETMRRIVEAPLRRVRTETPLELHRASFPLKRTWLHPRLRGNGSDCGDCSGRREISVPAFQRLGKTKRLAD